MTARAGGAGGGELGETAELLQGLIRNACVSTGWPSTGEEVRNAQTLRDYLDGTPGLDLEWFEPVPGRPSLVARLEGTDRDAPSLAYVGHTDVVPVDATGWREDPFGGELIDGEIWGRGAVDMLNQTAAMAVAVRRLAASGFRPRGTLVYAAVPDEECGGHQGARLLLEQRPELAAADYVVTEVGGMVTDAGGRALVDVSTAEKGGGGIVVTIRGTPGHGSVPFGVDNPLFTAAEVLRRLREHQEVPVVTEAWVRWVEAQAFAPELKAALVDAARIPELLPTLSPGLAAKVHACTHTTFAPTIVRGGDKVNVLPSRVRLWLNHRLLPGDTAERVVATLLELLADLGAGAGPEHRITVDVESAMPSSSSPPGGPLWDAMEEATRSIEPGAELVPSLLTAQTDLRWWRPAGAVGYGFGLMSRRMSPAHYWSMFHAHDERIDLESLELSTLLWERVAQAFAAR